MLSRHYDSRRTFGSLMLPRISHVSGTAGHPCIMLRDGAVPRTDHLPPPIAGMKSSTAKRGQVAALARPRVVRAGR